MKTRVMIKAIYKTAVTSKITIRDINPKELCTDYEDELRTEGRLRIDLPVEVSTILGCRYLGEQPYDIMNIYGNREKFIMSFEPLPFDAPVYKADIYSMQINSNPKSNDFSEDDCGQFITVPSDMFYKASYETEILDDSEELPRHMVCRKIQ